MKKEKNMLNIAQEANLKPPKAAIIPHTETAHGEERSDPYSWIRDKENPAVIDYLKSENEYADAVIETTANLQEKLFQEMKGRVKEEDSDPPNKKGAYFYYERKEIGKDYKIICRKKDELNAGEEIILDVNTLATGFDYYDLGQYNISPDHLLIAYLYDNNGSERYSLKIKNLTQNTYLKEDIKNVAEMAWAADNQTIFYTTKNESSRSDKLFRLGTPSENDPLVFHEQNDSCWVEPYLSKNEKYVFVNSEGLESNEILYLKADQPADPLKMLFPRIEGVEYSVEHFNGDFYILSNEWDSNFDLLKRLLVIENSTKELHYVNMDEDNYSLSPSSNLEFNTDTFRFTYSSFTTPRTFYDYNFKTREKIVVKRDEIPSGYNPNDYQSKRIWIPSEDGTKIPVSIVYKKGLVKDGSNPMFLTAYGAYGITSSVRFKQTTISLLDRGFVFAIAHIRGGGYLGKDWFNQGKLLNKKNSFIDFIAWQMF